MVREQDLAEQLLRRADEDAAGPKDAASLDARRAGSRLVSRREPSLPSPPSWVEVLQATKGGISRLGAGSGAAYALWAGGSRSQRYAA
jgi:hypothetical protein